MKHHRATRAEINLEAFRHNLRFLRSVAGSSAKIMAVVKADAYGHAFIIVFDLERRITKSKTIMKAWSPLFRELTTLTPPPTRTARRKIAATVPIIFCPCCWTNGATSGSELGEEG